MGMEPTRNLKPTGPNCKICEECFYCDCDIYKKDHTIWKLKMEIEIRKLGLDKETTEKALLQFGKHFNDFMKEL